jgi:HSP20 family protein
MADRNLMRRNGNGGYGFGRTFSDIFDIISEVDKDLNVSNITGRSLNVTTDEDTDNYFVKAEMPGISKDDIDISVEDGLLSISANYSEEGENMLRQGKYSWTCRVGDIDYDNIGADLKDGILTLTLPKSEKVKPRKITIN